MRKYLKMNDNDNYLSLGNLLRLIKEVSRNTSNSVQTEIFCLLFDVDNINSTTVNNYCVGSRRIGDIYKQKYLNYQKKYLKDKSVMQYIYSMLINAISGHNYDVNNKIDFINNHELFIMLTTKLFIIMKNDTNISTGIVDKVNNLINDKNYYDAFSIMLFYCVLENKQPRYTDEEIKDTINDLIMKSNISLNDIRDILEIELREGLSYYRSLVELSEYNNPYALYKLARMEYLGEVTGEKNIVKCFEYLNRAALFNHPASLWMMAHLMLNKELYNEIDYAKVWEYLNKAYEMGSIASINTMGLCYLNGWTKDGKVDERKAIEYFNEAIRHNYVYGYNNLGKYYENKNDLDKALEYYLLSANQKESWACNKVGEIYRKKNDLKRAFKYYNLATCSSINEICPYAWYNLAKYFYLDGCSLLLIPKDINKAIELFKKSSRYLIESKIELLILMIKENYSKDEIYDVKNQIEQDKNYNNDIRLLIEEKIKKIKDLKSITL